MTDKGTSGPGNVSITLAGNGGSKTVDLYSDEGRDLVASLWVKLSSHYRVMYEPTWLGIPIIQFPTDIVMMEELIWKVRPDFIVECGLAHGGSAVMFASICELIGKGQVIGVDVEIRQYNRAAIMSHPMSKRIELIEGSSIDHSVVAEIKRRVAGAETVLVVLDSNHSRDHVLKELNLYGEIVTPNSYMVAMDGAQALVWDTPNGKEEWKEDNPLVAIHEFLKKNPNFQIDPHYTRMHITSSPDGFLRRLTAEELK